MLRAIRDTFSRPIRLSDEEADAVAIDHVSRDGLLSRVARDDTRETCRTVPQAIASALSRLPGPGQISGRMVAAVGIGGLGAGGLIGYGLAGRNSVAVEPEPFPQMPEPYPQRPVPSPQPEPVFDGIRPPNDLCTQSADEFRGLLDKPAYRLDNFVVAADCLQHRPGAASAVEQDERALQAVIWSKGDFPVASERTTFTQDALNVLGTARVSSSPVQRAVGLFGLARVDEATLGALPDDSPTHPHPVRIAAYDAFGEVRTLNVTSASRKAALVKQAHLVPKESSGPNNWANRQRIDLLKEAKPLATEDCRLNTIIEIDLGNSYYNLDRDVSCASYREASQGAEDDDLRKQADHYAQQACDPNNHGPLRPYDPD